jgi:hypothetical protein
MSQLNVDQIKNRAGTGPALEMLSGGNVAIDTDTFYIDTNNDRIGINTASPEVSLHVAGGDGCYFEAHPMIEKIDTINSSSNGSTTLYAGNGSIHRYTSNNNGNFTPNFYWASGENIDGKMNTGDSMVQTIISPNQSNSGYCTSINIDGSNRSVEWQDGEQPDERGGDSGYDVYQFTIIKTGGNSFIIFGNQTYCN